MQLNKFFIVATLLVILVVGLSACGNSPDDTASINYPTEPGEILESTDDSSPSNGSVNDSATESDNSANTETTVTKIEGRKIEFIQKLDNIQKELDALPEKKDSDKGVTNAMKNYYGISYEMYDKALNEIYALLKEELSPETMNELKTEQMKWIEQKEDTADEERKKYEGGTFEYVAYYISTYESTKERCYELVNDYMTD